MCSIEGMGILLGLLIRLGSYSFEPLMRSSLDLELVFAIAGFMILCSRTGLMRTAGTLF